MAAAELSLTNRRCFHISNTNHQINEEIRDREIKSDAALEAPEIDITAYADDYGIVQEAYDEAVLDWIQKVGDALEGDDYIRFVDDIFDPAINALSGMHHRRALQVSEMILRAHNMAYNYYA